MANKSNKNDSLKNGKDLDVTDNKLMEDDTVNKDSKNDDAEKNGFEKNSDTKKNKNKKAKIKDNKNVKIKDNDTIDKLNNKLSDLQSKYNKLEDSYLRSEAEMQNMTKRLKKEQAQLLKYEGQKLAKDVLPVMDNLQRALGSQSDSLDNYKQLKHGIEMIIKDMDKAFKDNDITKIESLGKKFDPTRHQAVKTVPVSDGQESDTIVEVYQDGYMLKDRVLRPAMVVVAQ